MSANGPEFGGKNEGQPGARTLVRRPSPLKPIGRMAFKAARKALAHFGLSEAALIENWPEIAGPGWAERAYPMHLNRRSATLTVRVSGAHALEFQHKERLLLERIATYCGRTAVTRLKIVQGPLPTALPRPVSRPVPPETEAHVRALAAPIADEALRTALVDLGLRIAGESA